MTARVHDWPEKLTAYLAQRRCMPFAWGVHDCCQFARRGVQAQLGRDPIKGRQLKLTAYRKAATAQRILDRVGGVEALPEKCGLAEVPVKRAHRGDLVLSPDIESRRALGICAGEKSVFAAKDGLLFVPTLACTRAWRVG